MIDTCKRHILVFVFVWTSSACGQSPRETTFAAERAVAPIHIPDNFIDPAAKKHVDQFFADAAKFNRQFVLPDRLRVTFVESNDTSEKAEVGYCTRR